MSGIASARAWFAGRTLRERRLILVMVALAAVTLLWALVILPVRNGLSSARARYSAAVVQLGAAEAQLAAVKRIQRRAPGAVPLPLADTIRARADTAGLPVAALDAAAPDRVRVQIATARAGALMAWLAGLESEGVLVDDLTVAPGAPGTVSATMTLKARAS